DEAYLLDTQGQAVAEESEKLSAVVHLYQNYPNPFSRVTTISYEIPARMLVTLAICDVSGRTIASLVDEVQDAGKYTVRFVADDLPGDVYFCVLKTGKTSAANRMVLLK
ncbi:MAG: T9SS type A sorting domain-containing protein, partial [candidate division WOR-3 bacterium]